MGEIHQPTSGDMEQLSLLPFYQTSIFNPIDDTGFLNEPIHPTDANLLKNIRAIQTENSICLSDSLVKTHGRCSLDIAMETGTGKTYVYIKTMFELNKRYG